MTPFDAVLVRLLLAAAGSLAVGCGVWAVLVLCTRSSPALAQQRSLWLLGQVAVAAVFVAMLLPTSERLRVVPVIDMEEPVAPQAPPASAPPPASAASAAVPTAASGSPHMWLRDAGRVWLVLYLLGLGHALVRWRRARRLLDALIAAGHRLTGLHGHAGFATRAHGRLPAVIEIEAPVSPMLHGLSRPRLLLPQHLRSFEPLQQQLIVEHELTHWRRHDPYWSAAAHVLQTLFWFNPPMRMLAVRLGWAQEFGCDREVLRERPPGQRKAYAAALIAQLKLQQPPAGTALAFGAGGEPTLSARVDLIRSPIAARGARARCAALAGIVAVACFGLALQPALGRHAAGVPDDGTALLARTWPGLSSDAAASLDCTLIVDAGSGASLVHQGSCDRRVTPASTFKIAISLMGFDSGVLRDEHAPYLPYKQHYVAWNPSWRQGADPARWLRESVSWYSDEVRSRVGATAVRRYVEAFGYGNLGLPNVAGVKEASALSELSPALRISPVEQTVFLRKLVNRRLPVSGRAQDMTARLLKVRLLENGWQVYGKTGTANRELPDGGEVAVGWFVGWASKGGRTLVFARLLEGPARSDGHAGPLTRDAFLDELARSTL